MDTTETTLQFDIVNKVGFEDALNKIIRRFKVSCDVQWGESYTHKSEKLAGGTFQCTYHPVTVTLSMGGFKIDGYTYLGCIKDEDRIGLLTIHGNEATKDLDITSFVESFDSIPCHKCNRRHSRKIGHLFLEDATNEIKVFGSGCSKKYFGIDFTRLLTVFERINTGIKEFNEEYIRGMVKNHIDFKFISKVIFKEITDSGYMSGSKAIDNGLTSTTDYVKDTLIDIKTKNIKKDKMKSISEVDVDFDVLVEKEYTLKGEFGFNIKTIQKKLDMNCLVLKDLGFLVWMIFDEFFKEKSKDGEKIEYSHGEWKDGDKLSKVEVEMIHCHTFEGYYGTTNIYSFVNGDVKFKWFTGVNLELEVGDKVVINSGTVKKLDDDKKFGKSVIITRCRVK